MINNGIEAAEKKHQMSQQESQEFIVDRVKKRLELFFTDEIYTQESIEEGLETGDIFIKPVDTLPFLQTALLDEKIVEVEMDGMTRVYFGRISDDPPPDIEEEIDGETVITKPDYNVGDYLKEMSHIISLPLEPGIGNVHIRHAKHIMLRLFMTSYAVELGCFFGDMAEVNDIPVLQLGYPVIGRIVRGAREFRAKVPHDYDLKIMIVGKRRQSTLTKRVADISASGCSFSIKKEEQELFRIDENRTFEFIQEGLMLVRLTGKVRHVSKIRGKKGTEYLCGLQLDLVTRSMAAKVEKIVATVQRAHLKELSDMSEESGLDLKT